MVIDKIRIIEETIAVSKIKVNNEYIWPVLRHYVAGLLYQKDDNVQRNQTVSAKKLLIFFKSGLKGIFKLFFIKYQFLYFGKAESRRNIDGKFHHRVLEGAMSINSNKSLLIESPIPINHYPSKDIFTQHLTSESPFYLIQGFLMLFMRINLNGVNQIKQIENRYGIKIKYAQTIKRYRAQYITIKWLLNYKQIKLGVFVAPTLYNGYIKAFKEKGIPVVEMQHGVINEQHYAYNIFHSLNRDLLPNYLLTYGESTKNLLNSTNRFIDSNNIIPVGSYFLDAIEATYQEGEKILDLKKNYKTSIAISGQEIFEEKLILFLTEVATKDNDILFVYIPRKPKSYKQFNLPNNLIICTWLNVYEAIISCNLHTTYNSSCALEAPQLGKQNILVDFNKQASAYYSNILTDRKVTQFVSSPKQYLKAVYSLPKLKEDNIKFSTKSLCKPDHKKNMTNFFNHLKNE